MELIENPNHLSDTEVFVDVSNGPADAEPISELTKEEKHAQCISEIQSIFNKGYSEENGAVLINFLQKQRSLLIEIMIENFLSKPNSKMADAINTTIAQMEKSVRDDRKEAERAKELQTSKESFDLFIKSMSAVTSGEIKIPRFGAGGLLLLDPNESLLPEGQDEIKVEELSQGKDEIDLKTIETAVLEGMSLVSDKEETE